MPIFFKGIKGVGVLISIEDFLSAKSRIKVFKAIAEEGEISVTQLVRKTKLNYKVVRRNLDLLGRLKIVEQRHLGRVRLLQINMSNPLAKVLIEFILKWEILQGYNGRLKVEEGADSLYWTSEYIGNT